MFFRNFFFGRTASGRGIKRNRSKEQNRRSRRIAFRSELARTMQIESLESRQLLAVTAALDGSFDAVITGTAAPDVITMDILNPGLVNETLRISDLGGATAVAPFTQDDANTVSILTSAITGGDISIASGLGADTVNIRATPGGLLTTVNAR